VNEKGEGDEDKHLLFKQGEKGHRKNSAIALVNLKRERGVRYTRNELVSLFSSG